MKVIKTEDFDLFLGIKVIEEVNNVEINAHLAILRQTFNKVVDKFFPYVERYEEKVGFCKRAILSAHGEDLPYNKKWRFFDEYENSSHLVDDFIEEHKEKHSYIFLFVCNPNSAYVSAHGKSIIIFPDNTFAPMDLNFGKTTFSLFSPIRGDVSLYTAEYDAAHI